jgi:glycine/D-amino acid oxidase-like deaminating enzyme
MMHTPLARDARILIIGGGGTFGASTALHLARRGYTNVVACDQFEVPSAQSGGVAVSQIVPPS